MYAWPREGWGGYLGYCGLSFLVCRAGVQGFYQEKRERDSLSVCSRTAVAQRAVMCPGFAGSNTFRVSLSPWVDYRELRDGIVS